MQDGWGMSLNRQCGQAQCGLLIVGTFAQPGEATVSETGSPPVSSLLGAGHLVARTSNIRRTVPSSTLTLRSCSHTRMTVQPCSCSNRLTFSSRVRFSCSLRSQNGLRSDGIWPCSGHPCQKHPSTNTAIRAVGNTRSGDPGSFLPVSDFHPSEVKYLTPACHNLFRSLSSGCVLRDFTAAMFLLRSSGDLISTPRLPFRRDIRRLTRGARESREDQAPALHPEGQGSLPQSLGTQGVERRFRSAGRPY